MPEKPLPVGKALQQKKVIYFKLISGILLFFFFYRFGKLSLDIKGENDIFVIETASGSVTLSNT